jgi:hypothetical protein
MSFIKIGDKMKILDIYDCNIKEGFCPECGKKLTVIAVDSDENKLICEDCELDTQAKD